MILIWLILEVFVIQNATHANYSTPMFIDHSFGNINWFTASAVEQAVPVVPSLLPYGESGAVERYGHQIDGMAPIGYYQNVFQQPQSTWHQQWPYYPTAYGINNEHRYPVETPSYFFHPSVQNPESSASHNQHYWPVQQSSNLNLPVAQLPLVFPDLLSHSETSAFERYDHHMNRTAHPNRQQENVLQQPWNQQWSHFQSKRDSGALSFGYDLPTVVSTRSAFSTSTSPEVSTSVNTEVGEVSDSRGFVPGYDTEQSKTNATFQQSFFAASSGAQPPHEEKVKSKQEVQNETNAAGSSLWRPWGPAKRDSLSVSMPSSQQPGQGQDDSGQGFLVGQEITSETVLESEYSVIKSSKSGGAINNPHTVQSSAGYSGQTLATDALEHPGSVFNNALHNAIVAEDKLTQMDVTDNIPDIESMPLHVANLSADLQSIMSTKSVNAHFSEASLSSSAVQLSKRVMLGSESETRRAVELQLECPSFVPIAKKREQKELSQQSTVTTAKISHESLLCLSPEQSTHLAVNNMAQTTQNPASKRATFKRLTPEYSCSSSIPKKLRSGISGGLKPCSSKMHNGTFDQNVNTTRYIEIRAGKKRHACKQCNRTFDQSSGLTEHIRIHTGEKSYVCGHCNRSFNDKGNLKRHIQIHTGEKPYPCKHCNCSFKRKEILSRHVRIHTGERPYVCGHCNRSFSDKGDLKRHIRIHTGEKPYDCKHCNCSFNRKEILSGHVRLHTGEKPHVCMHCNHSFSQKQGLKRHIRIHTAEKPYPCKHCNCSFRQKKSLKWHIKIHTEDRPFQCGVCSKRFSSPDKFRHHEWTHNTEKGQERKLEGEALQVEDSCKNKPWRSALNSAETVEQMLVDVADVGWDSEDDIPLAALSLSH